MWRHTPRELREAVEADADLRDQRAQRDAYLLANLLQPYSKDRLKPTDFYTPRVTNPEQEKREMERFRALLPSSTNG